MVEPVNHIEEGLGSILSQFETDRRFKALLASYLVQFQEIEDAISDVRACQDYLTMTDPGTDWECQRQGIALVGSYEDRRALLVAAGVFRGWVGQWKNFLDWLSSDNGQHFSIDLESISIVGDQALIQLSDYAPSTRPVIQELFRLMNLHGATVFVFTCLTEPGADVFRYGSTTGMVSAGDPATAQVRGSYG